MKHFQICFAAVSVALWAAGISSGQAPGDALSGRMERVSLGRIRLVAGESQLIARASRSPVVSIDLTRTTPSLEFPVQLRIEESGEVRAIIPPATPPGEYKVDAVAHNLDGSTVSVSLALTVDAVTVPMAADLADAVPVILLNGYQFICFSTDSTVAGSIDTFGQLAQLLQSDGIPVLFFNNCAYGDITIERLAAQLNVYVAGLHYANGTPVTQVDLVAHSMGGLIARAYLAGMQTNGSFSPPPATRLRKLIEIGTPNFGSFQAPTGYTQTFEMVPGSTFLWSLATWNQGQDDFRGTDVLSVVGNGGTHYPPGGLDDGVVSLTSGSLGFFRSDQYTRIVPYCHTTPGPFASLAMDCTGHRGIADIDNASHLTARVVRSFLKGTSEWSSLGSTPTQDPWLSQYGGMFVALRNSAGQFLSDLTQVSFGQIGLKNGGATGAVFYSEFVNGSRPLQFQSQSLGSVNCGNVAEPIGYFSLWPCKFSTSISSVGPLLTGTLARTVRSGGNITILGRGFGQACASCTVAAYSPGGATLAISSWTDQAITALLPSTYSGLVGIAVQTASGSDYINIMAVSPPPTISLSNSKLQFAYTVGGALPTPQTITIDNSGGGTLTWVASPSAPWVVLGAPPLTVSINPTGLNPGTYQGAVTITVTGATNNPQTVSVTLTVSGAVVQLTTKNSASFGILALAPDVIAFSEAPGIASALAVAPGNPWPPTLGGVSLEITDSQGQKRVAPLYYVTTNAMSYLIPAETALGLATAKLTTSTGATITGTFVVDRVSPGLFTANATGSGVPAGFWIRAAADGTQTQDYLFDPTKPLGSRAPVPVDLGTPTDQVFLSLYGTGFRGAAQVAATIGGVTVPVAGFSAVGVYQGEDVVNIGPLPRSLAGRAEVGVGLTFDSKSANTVIVNIR